MKRDSCSQKHKVSLRNISTQNRKVLRKNPSPIQLRQSENKLVLILREPSKNHTRINFAYNNKIWYKLYSISNKPKFYGCSFGCRKFWIRPIRWKNIQGEKKNGRKEGENVVKQKHKPKNIFTLSTNKHKT